MSIMLDEQEDLFPKQIHLLRRDLVLSLSARKNLIYRCGRFGSDFGEQIWRDRILSEARAFHQSCCLR